MKTLPDELSELRRGVRDLAALTALSAVWNGRAPDQIAETLADALLSILDVEFLYVRVTSSDGQDAIEVARADRPLTEAASQANRPGHHQPRHHRAPRAEENRQHLLEQLVNAQEDERRRISRELHDTLGQHLTALHLGLKSVQDKIDPALKDNRIQQLRELAIRFDDAVDRWAFELRPAQLDDLGLEAALRPLVKEWSATSSIPVDMQTIRLDNHRLPIALETTLYRVVQEALTNILRHAQATGVSLIVERHSGEVMALVEDNGCGFDLKSTMAAPGAQHKLGITGMEERVALVGGRLAIESTLGTGTPVYVHIPLPTGGALA